jgi:hypothetical protein
LKTAVDSSVLLDVLGADPEYGERSRDKLRAAFDSGALVVCDVVWAEVRAHFSRADAFEQALGILGVRFDPISDRAAALAGELWRKHRSAGNGPRARLIADFLIGAHGLIQADVLLTRDRGFFRTYFRRLVVIDPSRA